MVYQRAAVSHVLNSGPSMVRAGHNAKEIMIPRISVTGLGDYVRNVGYKTGSINDADARDCVALGSDFFSLDPGDRILSITGCSYHETRFTERWA